MITFGEGSRVARARGVQRAVSSASERLLEAAGSTPEQVLARLRSSGTGLTAGEAAERLTDYGANEATHEAAPPWWRQLLSAFLNPFIGILVALAITSFVTEVALAAPEEQDPTGVIIITVMVVLSVALTFAQEYRASKAAEALLSLVQPRARVRRADEGVREIPTVDLVPGDVVHLAAGDVVPGDAYLLETNDLMVNESALTGESLPAEKHAGHDDPVAAQRSVEAVSALELQTVCFMGTHVASGTARIVLIATGDHTYFGAMAGELVGHHPPTSFDRGVKQVSLLLIRFMLVMVPIILLINGFTKGDWFQAALFALAVAVGLTPEMLPMIVTTNLAKGGLEMARHKAIVKRLSAIQNLGAMDLLCTDKTGTLTEDAVGLERSLDVDGEASLRTFELAYLNAMHQTGLRNPLDAAIVAHPDAASLPAPALDRRKIGEVPFETARRRMSVIVEHDERHHLLVCKGASAEMLASATGLEQAGQVRPLTAAWRERIAARAAELTTGGLRILLVGYRLVDPTDAPYGVQDERDLTIVGFVGFLDPPKPSAGEAIEALGRSGVWVQVITGDNELATRRTCADIGFTIDGLLAGHEVDAMSDDELTEAVRRVNVFVRTAPLQKARLVAAAKRAGHTVGFLGDGINDAPALRDADVGVSVDNAVDIAKESADILLLEKDLMVLGRGIASGRRVFGNTMKYVKITASSNFGNVFSVLVASVFLPFPPMMPLHLLIQNLLYDVSQMSIPWDNVDEAYVRRPREWNARSIARFMLVLGPISSIFDFTTFALLWFVFAATTVEQQALFHSGWFVLGLVSQTVIVHMIRTQKVPFVQSMASRPVLVMTALVVVVGMVLPFTGYGAAVGFVPLPASYFVYFVLTVVAYCLLIQAVKGWYVRRYGTWL